MAKPEFSVSFRVTEPFHGYAADIGKHMLESEAEMAEKILKACDVHWNGFAKCYSTQSLGHAYVAVNALRQYGLSVIVSGFDVPDRPEGSIPMMHHIRAASFSRELDLMKEQANLDRARRFAKARPSDPGPQIQVVDVDEAFRT